MLFAKSDIRRCFVWSSSWISPAVLHSKSIAGMMEMDDRVGSDRWSGSPSLYCPMAVSNNFSNFSISSWNWLGWLYEHLKPRSESWQSKYMGHSTHMHTVFLWAPNIWASFWLWNFWYHIHPYLNKILGRKAMLSQVCLCLIRKYLFWRPVLSQYDYLLHQQIKFIKAHLMFFHYGEVLHQYVNRFHINWLAITFPSSEQVLECLFT